MTGLALATECKHCTWHLVTLLAIPTNQVDMVERIDADLQIPHLSSQLDFFRGLGCSCKQEVARAGEAQLSPRRTELHW
jgi:hypothetical protein